MAGKMLHTPSKSMVSAAKRGVAMVKDGGVNESDVPDISLKGGKKIASGQQISDDHVRSMAHYHGAHFPQFSGTKLMSGGCPTGGDAEQCDDLLWGGPAGASWSASRVAAMDATALSDDENAPDVEALLSGDDGFSIELFSRGKVDELDMTKDADGLIWAPIIRSGTLAMRPDPTSPDGRKAQPLVFVAGNSSDPSKEIGLQDLKNAFDDRAVEHVTIPKTHANDTLENTGEIVKLKISDSTIRPGEKVLVAGHKFTEPDVEGKVVRGSVRSRSCGILHSFVNQETGKRYPHVIEHVALTNKPWVTGMEPYGSDCFSDNRKIVPMLLSEEIVVPPPTDTAPKGKPISTEMPEDELKKELALADVQWGDEPSLSSIQSQLYDVFREMGRSPDYDESSVYFSIRDVTPTKALVSVDYGDPDGENDAWVIPFSMDDTGKLTLSDFAEWKPVEQQWVTDDDADRDKQEVQQILQGATNMSDPAAYLESVIVLTEDDLNLATLTEKKRKSLDPSDFVFPPKDGKPGRYPVPDLAHARNALARVAQNGTPEEQAKVKSAVKKKYPDIDVGGSKPSDKSKSNMSDDPLVRAQQLRLSQESQSNQHTGGTMGLTPDLLAQLDLSDEAREVLQREMSSEEQDRKELADLREERKRDGVKERVKKLSDMGFSDCPGLLKYVEQTLLSDDGKPAIRLDLADGSGQKIKTVTDVIDGLIASMPQNDGKIDLSGKGNLLSNPLDRRPDLEPTKLGEEGKTITGDEMFAGWQKAAGGTLDLELAPSGAPTTAAPAGKGQ